jgi:hypothetical protein
VPLCVFRARSPLRRDGITRAIRNPGHAAEYSRGSEPEAFRETVGEHRFLGIVRASRLEPATDETIANRFQQRSIPADRHSIINDNRNLFRGRPRPIAKRRGGQNHRDNPNGPGAGLPYGWPQCGQTGLPSMRFFLQCGHGTRLTFGRVARWTINPTTGTSQARIVTS